MTTSYCTGMHAGPHSCLVLEGVIQGFLRDYLDLSILCHSKYCLVSRNSFYIWHILAIGWYSPLSNRGFLKRAGEFESVLFCWFYSVVVGATVILQTHHHVWSPCQDVIKMSMPPFKKISKKTQVIGGGETILTHRLRPLYKRSKSGKSQATPNKRKSCSSPHIRPI